MRQLRPPPLLVTIGLVVLIVVGAVAAVVLPASGAKATVRPTAGGGSAPTVTATFVCPDRRMVAGTLTTLVAAGSAAGGAGSLTIGSTTAAAGGTNLLTGTGAASAGLVKGYAGKLTGPLTIQAQGALSGSLVVEQLSRGSKTADRGFAETRCEPPGSLAWFIGAATEPGDAAALVLANPGNTTAITDVTVLTPAGTSLTALGQNLSLAPHSVRNIALTSLAPGVGLTAIRVSTTRGEVSAALRDVRTSGTTLLGTDWIPQGVPAQRVVVAGIPGTINGTGPTRVLDLANPGPTDTTVSVTLTGPQGTYVPTGLSAIAVPAGAVRAVNVTKSLGSGPATLTVTSSEPDSAILAGVLVDAVSTVGSGIHEIAYLGSSEALAGPALVPLIRCGKGLDSVLILSGTQGAVPTAITVRSPTGATSQFRVVVPAGGTIAISLRAHHLVSNDVVTVTPDPGSPPLYGSRILEQQGDLGPLISAFQLVGNPSLQKVPQVAPQPLGAS